MKSEFMLAITQLAAEKHLPKEVVLRVVEAALVSAFRKDNLATSQGLSVKISPQIGEVRVYVQRTVVENVADPRYEISLAEARNIKKDAQIGDTVEVESTPKNAGRIAAQVAKQVILQRLREAERDAIFAEYAEKEGDIISGVVQRIEPKQIIIDLGRTEAILPASEQVTTERYRVGQRIKVYLVEVLRVDKASLIVSRAHRNLLRRLFELEVPEIYNGTVELKAIAREAGSRSKVAVAARQEGVDSVGCCVGLRGIRIQNITRELNGEKVDVVQWSPAPEVFIANALSPAPVVKVGINAAGKVATVIVPDRQLSLAIGKEGQNARLAARLTGWRIDIKSASVAEAEKVAKEEALRKEAAAVVLSKEEKATAAEAVAIPSPSTKEVAEIEKVPALVESSFGVETALPVEEISLEALGAIPLEEKQQLRFAEDFLPKSTKPDIKAKRDKKKGTEKEEKAETVGAAKPRKGRRQRLVFVDEEGYEDIEEADAKP